MKKKPAPDAKVVAFLRPNVAVVKPPKGLGLGKPAITVPEIDPQPTKIETASPRKTKVKKSMQGASQAGSTKKNQQRDLAGLGRKAEKPLSLRKIAQIPKTLANTTPRHKGNAKNESRFSLNSDGSLTKKPPNRPKGEVIAFKQALKNDIALIWLYCPQCQSFQYTALAAPGGRHHLVCGSPVREKLVNLSAGLEMGITLYNLALAGRLRHEYRTKLDDADNVTHLSFARSVEKNMQDYQAKLTQAFQIASHLNQQEAERRLAEHVAEKSTEEWKNIALSNGFVRDSYNFLHSPFFLSPLTHFLVN